jgi:alpha/beta superfamily hydrolase
LTGHTVPGTKMEAKREIFFRCGSIVLEGIAEVPQSTESRLAGAVICHPHPLYGGNMHNHVVRIVQKALLSRDTVCLRFNFRGTGRSEGAYGNGIDELEDVRAALDFLAGLDIVNPDRMLVAGYSFGCWVGLRAAANDPRPAALIGVSPPLNEYDFGFLKNEKRPKLLVVGDGDFVCSTPRFEELVAQIPEPKRGVIFPGADHFSVGDHEGLLREIDAFLDEFPPV